MGNMQEQMEGLFSGLFSTLMWMPLFMMLMSVLVFGTIIGVIVWAISKHNKQESQNANSPRITVEAVVIAKRTHVSSRRRAHSHSHMHASYRTSTTYYITFQLINGSRTEMKVTDQDYGYIVEGDRGNLTFQGTWFLGFQRI